MRRTGAAFFLFLMVACGNEKKVNGTEDDGFSYGRFADRFRPASVPYLLTDTGLAKSRDTVELKFPEVAAFIPDSLKSKFFGKAAKIKYFPLRKVQVPKGESYFILKAAAGAKKAAYLVAFDKAGAYAATLPFLVPDNEASTSQSSSIDRGLTVSRNVVRRKQFEITGEGKDVFVFNEAARQFTLIMTDLLDESSVLVNPIDTLPRKGKYAGDYLQGKNNMVSIRDGRNANQALAFVHIVKNNGECTGELKGEIFFTSTTTAVYRQGGDPCVLQFSFTPSSVTLKEEQGCGNHRGLDCALEGQFTKKKPARPKTASKKRPEK